MGLDQYATARKGEPRTVKSEYTYTDLDGTEHEGVEEYLEWDDSIELAKHFGGADSYRFVNQVLDKMAKVKRKVEVDHGAGRSEK